MISAAVTAAVSSVGYERCFHCNAYFTMTYTGISLNFVAMQPCLVSDAKADSKFG